MKTNEFTGSSLPSVKEQPQTSSASHSKSKDESRLQKCPYCVNCENDESSQNSSPIVTTANTNNNDNNNNNRDSSYLCSSSECDSSSAAETLDTSSLDQKCRIKSSISQQPPPPPLPSLSKSAFSCEKSGPQQADKSVNLTRPVANVRKEEADASAQTALVDAKKLKGRQVAPTDSENSRKTGGFGPLQPATTGRAVYGTLDTQRRPAPAGRGADKRPPSTGARAITRQSSASKKKARAQHTIAGKRFEPEVMSQLKSAPTARRPDSQQLAASQSNFAPAPRPVFASTSGPEVWRKPASGRAETIKATIGAPTEPFSRNAQSSVGADELATTTTTSEMELLPASNMKTSPTKVEYSKLRTDGPDLIQPSLAKASTTIDSKVIEEAQSSATGKRPMKRCSNLVITQSAESVQQVEQRQRPLQPQKQRLQKHAQTTSSSKKLPAFGKEVLRAVRPPDRGRNLQSSTAQKSKSTRPLSASQSRRQPSSRSVSVEEVGADGGKAYIIRQERREKVNWRRRPRYHVKQTATSRLRYGYWFADCGRQRVKAFRGDWSRIPEEMLRDWEVYQNYFRYRLKNKQRKRTSSLVRKFIAGKYRQAKKPASVGHKRPIRKMSPLLRADQSPTPLDPFEPLVLREDGDDVAAAASTSPASAARTPALLQAGLAQGSNVRALLKRRARSQQRERQRAQQRLVHLMRSDANNKPRIKVRSTFTSRMRKHSTTEPCGKPLTPTLWHGSAGEMVELKQKIALRRQRLKENWLEQTAAIRAAAANKEGSNDFDERVAELMSRMIVVGAPIVAHPVIGAGTSLHCAGVRSRCVEPVLTRSKTSKATKTKTRAKKSKDRVVEAVAPSCIRLKKYSVANSPPALSLSSEVVVTAACASGTIPARQLSSPSSATPKSPERVIESSSPTSPSSLRKRRASKKKTASFMALRKLFSVAKWMIPPAIPIQPSLTSTLRRRRLNEKT